MNIKSKSSLYSKPQVVPVLYNLLNLEKLSGLNCLITKIWNSSDQLQYSPENIGKYFQKKKTMSKKQKMTVVAFAGALRMLTTCFACSVVVAIALEFLHKLYPVLYNSKDNRVSSKQEKAL